MTKKYPSWEQWEHEVQEIFSLDSTICSGSKFHDPGDAVSRANPHESSFRAFVDCKYTEKASYSLKREVWDAWVQRAAERGMRPVMALRIWPRGHLRPTDAVVIDTNDLAELIAKAEKLALIEKLYREWPEDPHAV